MNLIKIITVLFLFILSASLAKGQDIKIELKMTEGDVSQSSASGERLLQYNGYRLDELLPILLNANPNLIEIEEPLKFQRFSFKASFQDSIDKSELKQEVLKLLKRRYRITVVPTEVIAYELSQNEKLEECSEQKNSGFEYRISRINRTWKGSCVNSKQLAEIIEEWYGVSIVNKIKANVRFNVTIHHDDIDILINNLDQRFNINLSQTSIPTEKYKIFTL